VGSAGGQEGESLKSGREGGKKKGARTQGHEGFGRAGKSAHPENLVNPENLSPHCQEKSGMGP